MRQRYHTALIWISAIILLFSISIGFTIGMTFVKKESTYFIFRNIIELSFALVGVLTVISLRKHFHVISMAMIIGDCILSVGQLHFLNYRLFHQLLFSLFVFSVIYLIVYLLRFFVPRKKHMESETIHVNGIIPVIFTGFSFFMNAFQLSDLIATEMDIMLMPIVLIALGSAVTALILCILFIKNRQNKKKYYSTLATAFFTTFLLVFFIPIRTIEHINYAFDPSDGEKTEVVVIEKYSSHSYKGGTNYYLVLQINDREVDFPTNSIIYFQYMEGDTLYLYEHEGALHYPYYEYRLDSMYRYEGEG